MKRLITQSPQLLLANASLNGRSAACPSIFGAFSNIPKLCRRSCTSFPGVTLVIPNVTGCELVHVCSRFPKTFCCFDIEECAVWWSLPIQMQSLERKGLTHCPEGETSSSRARPAMYWIAQIPLRPSNVTSGSEVHWSVAI